MLINGSQIVIECLVEQGVDTVFGYPGGAVLNIYDALYKYSDKITHYMTAHEQGASHAADGYARSTGKTGVVITTSGPGATNIVTGIATANIDSIPIVAITGNVSTDQLGRDLLHDGGLSDTGRAHQKDRTLTLNGNQVVAEAVFGKIGFHGILDLLFCLFNTARGTSRWLP